MTYLISWHGTVLCRQRANGVVVHRPIVGPFEDLDLLSLGDLDRSLQVNLLHLLRDDIDRLNLTLPAGPMAGWAFSRAPDHRSLLLSNAGRVLVAKADGEMDLIRGQVDATACFLPVTVADFDALRQIVTARWLVQSEEPPRPVRGEVGPGFTLRIGSLALDLRWNVPLDLSEFPHRITVVRDGWRIDRIARYRPLVFYTAYAATGAVEQLELSLQSLVGPGGFDGDVAVLTDCGVDRIRALKPANMAGSIVVIHCDAADALAQQASRLAIAGWPDARMFQPLLYVDTDILFDMDVAPLMQALAMMGRIAASRAPAESDAPGADLVRDDAWDPEEMTSLMTAVLGIPNLGQHGHTLDLIGRIIRNRASLFGRGTMPQAEQSVANYVSFRLGPFDSDLITPFLRSAHEAMEDAEPAGLMHFGAISDGQERLDRMRRYLQRVGGVMPGDVVPTEDVATFSITPLLDFESIMQSLQQ